MQKYYREIDGINVEYQRITQWWVFPSVVGITINGKIYLKDTSKPSDRLLRHEYIHALQQEECGWIKFLFLYGWQWLIAAITFRDAYYSIKFEKEAYANQRKEGYLQNRKKFAWIKY